MQSLVTLDLSNNSLSGPLPQAWGQPGAFPQLLELSLNDNLLTARGEADGGLPGGGGWAVRACAAGLPPRRRAAPRRRRPAGPLPGGVVCGPGVQQPGQHGPVQQPAQRHLQPGLRADQHLLPATHVHELGAPGCARAGDGHPAGARSGPWLPTSARCHLRCAPPPHPTHTPTHPLPHMPQGGNQLSGTLPSYINGARAGRGWGLGRTGSLRAQRGLPPQPPDTHPHSRARTHTRTYTAHHSHARTHSCIRSRATRSQA